MILEEQISQLSEHLDKLPPILKKDLDKNLCVCNEVLRIDIITAIVNGAFSVADVRKQTYATMGSACCKQEVTRLIECLCSPKVNSDSISTQVIGNQGGV